MKPVKFKKNELMKLSVLILMLLLSFPAKMSAQTDYTSKIKNPSFESGQTSWTISGLQTQTNSVFTLKSGSTYMEKWTGKGGAVGSASALQSISGLAPGKYKLTAAAQNIQEDDATAAQSGAYIFAGDAKTTVTVRNTYSVEFTYVSGSVDIGFEAVNASGNWIAVDNFRLSLISTDLSEALSEAIDKAQTLYGDGSGKGSEALLEAINSAKSVFANESSTGEQQAEAIVSLEEAVDTYKRANASSENPLVLTSLIINNNFEAGNFTGWTNTNFQTQTNSDFSIKNGTYYIEKWVAQGNGVGDAKVSQTLTGMHPGKYRLRVAAQNTQGGAATTSGAHIFANSNTLNVTTRKQYVLEFVLISDELSIGFEAKNCSGNWIACDNFRLEYISDSFDEIQAAYNDLIARAEALYSTRMITTAKTSLLKALDTAKAFADQSTTDGWPAAAKALEKAMATATTSSDIFAALLSAINNAQTELDNSSASNKANYQAAIDAAQAIYDNSNTTNAKAQTAIADLEKAAFAFKIDNGSGAAPKVTTDKRFIKGATWAFGRSTVSGSNILEQGFCWSESPDPRVTDNRTTEYLNQQGKIYWLRDLKPGTMYYMRAYAITKDYAVGYGDVIKFATVPKGTITHWYNNGGDEATNTRINNAINNAMDYYWNNLTSIHDFGISVTYSPGTPTADCGYGGGMRVGANASYQSTGTIMHESLHGIGVGTHNIWWSGEMRSNGDRGIWLGDRVTEAVRFWDNNTTATITGDNTHLWPYGCNGAQEDTHSDNLYCMMGIIAQALNEDGLPGSTAIGYALPYYSFTHEDNVKYYIKNEDKSHGLYTSYLVETATHGLQWKAMTAEEAAADDAAAWYISFTPSTQYYHLKNAKSGYYITYSSSAFKTVKRTSTTSAENIHLMRGRVDVNIEKSTYRGYYFIHPESSATPPTLTASASSNTTSQGFNIAKSATEQRWIILTADEVKAIENASLKVSKQELTDLLKELKALTAVPHYENEEGVDNTFNSQISAIEAAGNASTSVTEINDLIEQAKNESVAFLSGVGVKDESKPFDLTYMLVNPTFDSDATTGWTTASNPNYGYQAAEFFQATFNFYQTLKNMPAGTYKLCANAFQRPGAYTEVYAPYIAGTAEVTTSLYIGSTAQAVCHICDDRQSSAPSTGCQQVGDNKYIPDNMQSGAAFFNKGLYESSVTSELAKSGSSLRVGIKCTKSSSGYWSMFDNFRLYFYGTPHDATAIDDINADANDGEGLFTDGVVYNLQGQKVGTSLEGLPEGIYIINGKKFLFKNK